MPERLFKHKLKILFSSIFVCGLIFVRAFEDTLFYDPFLKYFRSEFGNVPLPDFNTFKLFLALLARYFLNAFFSLGIIYILFKDLGLTKFSALIYLVFFILLIAALFVLLHAFVDPDKMVIFYVRRFLIQPILLLLFLPAFYFQRVVSQKNNIS